MSQPVLECVNDWVNDCLCGRSHMPCWPRPDTSCCSDLDTTGKTEEQVALIERMLHVSTEIMWRLSGKKYGACPVTVRPCKDDCGSSRQGYTWWNGIRWMPYLDNGVWFNDPCSICKTGCSCSELCEITLPGPVDSIVSVMVDGITVPPEQYRVDDGRKLVRLGDDCWPTCQDMNKPTTEVGTMAVTYRKGEAVPQGGLWAAGLLACQLIKACSAAADCALPSNAQRIVREGVTLDLDPLLIDATGFRTGIAEVDLWLSAVNPYRSTEPSVIMSPDTPRPRVTTWPCT